MPEDELKKPDVSSGDSQRPLRVLMLTAYPSAGGPLAKLSPLVVEGLRRLRCAVIVEGWSAHTSGRESVVAKVIGRGTDLMRVLRHVRRWRPDVIYVATTHNRRSLIRDIPLAALLPRSAAPLVLHLHGSECDRLGKKGDGVFTLLSVWLMHRAAAVLVLSREEQELWRRFCPDVRIEVVANPFLPEPESDGEESGRSADSGEPVLLIVARLMRQKGVFELLDALEIVRATQPCRLLMAGTGPEAKELARRAAAMGVTDSVSMPGYLTGSALRAAYAGADIFVLPTYSEGFPLSVMEAMASGLPIVTTRIRGCADHLLPDVNAVFVPPRDPAAVAAAVLRLLEDDELRRRMGRSNKAKVVEFAPEAVMPRYAEILRSVAGQRPEATREEPL